MKCETCKDLSDEKDNIHAMAEFFVDDILFSEPKTPSSFLMGSPMYYTLEELRILMST